MCAGKGTLDLTQVYRRITCSHSEQEEGEVHTT